MNMAPGQTERDLLEAEVLACAFVRGTAGLKINVQLSIATALLAQMISRVDRGQWEQVLDVLTNDIRRELRRELNA